VNSRRAERAATAAMVLVTLLWGATFIAIRDLVRVIGATPLVFGRFAVAAALLAVVVVIRRQRVTAASLRIGAVSGACMAVAYHLQAVGLRWTSAGTSAFLTCASTLFAGLLAWPLLGDRPSRTLLGATGVAIAGAAAMSLDATFRLGAGEAITLAGSLLFALQVVWLARNAAAIEPLAVSLVQCAVVGLLLAPFAGGAVRAAGALDAAGWWRFAYLAVAGSAIAAGLQVAAQRHLSAGRTGLLMGLEPVFALVFAFVLGHERFVARWWVGAAMILGAVVVVEWTAARAGAPPEPARAA
jgi:drug/metabolite transporter (DMT)-like permease